MPRILEYIGQPGPWLNPEKWVAALKHYEPSLTDREVVDRVHMGNVRQRPRHPNGEFHIFGRDILTTNLASIDAWPFLPDVWKQELPLYPITGGSVVDRGAETAAVALSNARMNPHKVNRESWVFPVGLSKTYVWCLENQFMQTVSDADVELIRRTPGLKLCFRDPNLADGALQIRDYTYPTSEQLDFGKTNDLIDFEADQTRVKQWAGV